MKICLTEAIPNSSILFDLSDKFDVLINLFPKMKIGHVFRINTKTLDFLELENIRDILSAIKNIHGMHFVKLHNPGQIGELECRICFTNKTLFLFRLLAFDGCCILTIP